MLHSKYRIGEIDYPERLLEQISNRLYECSEYPHSLAGELVFNDHNTKVILDQWFNY
ncbi:hypothetical protein NOVO_01295 [Rickettsiales bacterium Ac37b]|nr:hypothetical protein NOVO_01295 [Rickettsiales bacterium Ac37b]